MVIHKSTGGSKFRRSHPQRVGGNTNVISDKVGAGSLLNQNVIDVNVISALVATNSMEVMDSGLKELQQKTIIINKC